MEKEMRCEPRGVEWGRVREGVRGRWEIRAELLRTLNIPVIHSIRRQTVETICL